MQFGAGEDWAQSSREPVGEGDGVRVGGYEVSWRVSMRNAGVSAACDGLVQRIADERAIIGFVVADTEPVAGQRRDQGQSQPDRWSHKIPTSTGLAALSRMV